MAEADLETKLRQGDSEDVFSCTNEGQSVTNMSACFWAVMVASLFWPGGVIFEKVRCIISAGFCQKWDTGELVDGESNKVAFLCCAILKIPECSWFVFTVFLWFITDWYIISPSFMESGTVVTKQRTNKWTDTKAFLWYMIKERVNLIFLVSV